jgi:hypothetical protein
LIYEGDNHNLIVLKETSPFISVDDNDKFKYMSTRHGWHNTHSHFMISAEALHDGANVGTAAYNAKAPGQKWYIEYCEDHHHDHYDF